MERMNSPTLKKDRSKGEEDSKVGSLVSAFQMQEDEDSEYNQYLASLSSLSLERLSKEPVLLSQESQSIKQQMQQLAFHNYKAFTLSSDCVHDIHNGVSQVNVQLNTMLQNLSKLSTSCEDFVGKAKDISKQHNLNKIVLQNHTQILELLEIPQLMETFIRNEFYEEALQLEAFTHNLRKSLPDQRIIQEIFQEVESCRDVMLFQLHEQLRTKSIQVPTCMRIVGYLKRLGVYDEKGLRLSFLQSRGAWLQSVLDSIPTTNLYTYLSKYTDYSKIHVFDIVTQYRAIFEYSSAQDEFFDDGGLLCGWITGIVAQYVDTLSKYLPQITEGQSIAKLLDQCMWYGSSLGRVGLDFRGLLLPIFTNTIRDAFKQQVLTASTYFCETLKTFKFITPHKQLHLSTTIESSDHLAPPAALLDYHPLAVLLNGYLSALNELRCCAPLMLQNELSECLSECLQRIVGAVRGHAAQYSKRFSEDELKSFHRMTELVAEKMIPHVVTCFVNIYSGAHLDTTSLIDSLKSLYKPQPSLQQSFSSALKQSPTIEPESDTTSRSAS